MFIELIEFSPARDDQKPFSQDTVGYAYMSIKVEDLRAFYEHHAARGVQFLSPPLEVAGSPGGLLCFVVDPDGNDIEVAADGCHGSVVAPRGTPTFDGSVAGPFPMQLVPICEPWTPST